MSTVTSNMIRELRDRVGPDGLEAIRGAQGPTGIIEDYLYHECGWSHGEVDELMNTIVRHMLNTGPDTIAPVARSRELEW